MYFLRLFFISIIFIFCISCSKDVVEKSVIKETNLELQMIEAYKEGLKELEKGDALFAAKKFNEAEILFPQSDTAPRAAIMAAYSYYSQNYYLDSIAELDRFLRVYSNHKNIPYAKYLRGLCYYEQIVDENLIWSFIIQLTSALKTIHASGLACRNIHPSKIIVTSTNRLRISQCGVLDVLKMRFENRK